MTESEFAATIGRIRTRFAARLGDKIQETEAALPNLEADGSDGIEAVAIAYRQFHSICGVAGTIGFEAIAQVSRSLDAVLIRPFRERRALSGEEFIELKEGLKALKIAARNEKPSTDHIRS